MKFILVICFGSFLGICGDITEVEYSSYETCIKEKNFVVEHDKENNIKYVICEEKKDK